MDAESKAKFINSVAAGSDAAPAFAPAKERTVAPLKAKKYIEPQSAFAEGLPEWSIEPPQVPLRRH